MMNVTTSIQYLFLSRLSAFLLAAFSFCILRIASKHILFANSKLFFCFSVIITFNIKSPRCVSSEGGNDFNSQSVKLRELKS